MRRLCIIIVILFIIVSQTIAQEVTNESYTKCKQIAEDITKQYNKVIGTATYDELSAKVKEVLDVSFNLHFNLLALTSTAWEQAITMDVYLDKDWQIQLEQLQFNRKIQGYDLITEANRECIKIGMKRILILDSTEKKATDLLIDYYALYNQVYELDENPTGSYVSFNSKVNELKSSQAKLSSKLGLFIKE